MKGRKISKKMQEEIKKRTNAGEEDAALAKEFEISRQTIANIRKGRKVSSDHMTLEWIAAFKAAWANIYPGDAERERRRDESSCEVSGE